MLTHSAIRNAQPSDKRYKLFDGGGLYLEVYPAGGRYWRLKYTYGGKDKRLSLGVYPEVSLDDARSLKDKARALLKDGKDPARAKAEIRRAEREAAIAAFAHKKPPELTASEGVTYVTVLTDIVTSALGAFADQFFDRLERSSAQAQAPGKEEGSQ